MKAKSNEIFYDYLLEMAMQDVYLLFFNSPEYITMYMRICR
jgi:hypothetical protein